MSSESAVAKRIQWPTGQVREAAQRFGWGRLHSEMGVLSPEFQTGQHGPDPIHGGKDGWRVYQDYSETGGGHSNKDGAFPTGFHVIMRTRNCSYNEAVNAAGDFLHGLGVIGAPEKSGKGSKQRRDDSGKARTSSQGKGPAKESNWEELAKNRSLVPANRSNAYHVAVTKMWAQAKRPIQAVSLFASQVWIGKWYGDVFIIGVPFFQNETAKLPHAAALYLPNGKEFDEHTNQETGKTTPRRKTHLLKDSGTGDGWFFAGGRERFIASSRVLVCAGPPDCLSSLGMLPPEWSAVTNALGEQPELKFWLGRNAPPLKVFAGKTVFVVGDLDEVGQKSVRNKAAAIATVADSVFLVSLPPLAGVKDLRDWMALGHGWAEFEELIATAEQIEPAEVSTEASTSDTNAVKASPKNSAEIKPIASELDPFTEATNFLNQSFSHPDGHQLRFYRGEFFRWCGNVWREIPVDEIRGYIALHLAKLYDRVGSAAVSNVLEFVRAITNTSSRFNMPCWLDGREGDCIAFQNGIAMLDDLLSDGTVKLIPHSPAWFSETVLPYNFDPSATCPTWESVLCTNLEGDLERIQLLQEFVGYCLTKWVFYHLSLMLTGEGGEGKSVFLSGLRAIVGDQNCSKLSLDDLTHNFKRTQIVGKLANVCADLPETSKACEGVLKQLISGDSMEFDRKYKEPFSAIPTAKLIFSANSLPHLYDRTNGIWRRVRVVPFQRAVTESEKIQGMDQPRWWEAAGELPGMFNWALAGLKRLQRHKAFTRSSVCEIATTEHRLACNPAQQFLDDEYISDPHDVTSKTQIYGEYSKYCSANGFKALGSSAFGKEVKKKFGKLKEQRISISGFNRDRCYVGIRRKRIGDEPPDFSPEEFE